MIELDMMKTNIRIAAAATFAGGVLHLVMIGPFLKPANFPMELVLHTDIPFIVAGLAQIFWALSMIKGWGLRWYYPGIFGTAALSLLIKTKVCDTTNRTDISPICRHRSSVQVP